RDVLQVLRDVLQVLRDVLEVLWDVLDVLRDVLEVLIGQMGARTPQVVHRWAEVLKLFNSRTCQLVLGAGAMQVAGLKSITAKHLALANQSLTLILGLLPHIRRALKALLPEARHHLMGNVLDRLSQDYGLHRDEIHSKLLAIMQERLLVHSRQLPSIVELWMRDKEDADVEPSDFAKALVKEIGVLQRVLTPLLLQSELYSIFGRVSTNFNNRLIEAFRKLELSAPVTQRHAYCDGMHIANCLRSLPRQTTDGVDSPGALQEFLHHRFADAMGDSQ
ncbi:hypothetical protein CYMTET_47899, partial [Cymbomonas tetramitiformis]